MLNDKIKELQATILKMKLKTPYHPDLNALLIEYSDLLEAKKTQSSK